MSGNSNAHCEQRTREVHVILWVDRFTTLTFGRDGWAQARWKIFNGPKEEWTRRVWVRWTNWSGCHHDLFACFDPLCLDGIRILRRCSPARFNFCSVGARSWQCLAEYVWDLFPYVWDSTNSPGLPLNCILATLFFKLPSQLLCLACARLDFLEPIDQVRWVSSDRDSLTFR